MNKKGQFDFGLAPKKKPRVTPTRSEKNEIWDRQRGHCSECEKSLSPTTSEYHHKDGDRSNWRLSNITLVCAECHKRETNRQRVKTVQAKRREKESRENNPFGLGGGGLFDTKPKRTSSLWGPAPKRKQETIFSLGPINKKRKKNNPWGI